MKPILVHITAKDNAEAARIAEALVKQKLASCVMTLPEINSCYVWKGAIQHDQEALLLVKTFDTKYAALEKAVKRLHSYEKPCIIATPIVKGSKEYLDWSKGVIR